MNNITRNEWIAVAIGVAVVAFFFFTGSLDFTRSLTNNLNQTMDEQNQPAAVNDAATIQAPDGTEDRGGVIVQDTVVGEGTLAESGKYVALHYTGMLEDGTVFDSSIPRKKTFEFRLGAGDVIPGWDKGIEGMKIGGKRRLIISPEAGYGDQEIRHPQTKAVIIPANATLIFDVELLGVRI